MQGSASRRQRTHRSRRGTAVCLEEVKRTTRGVILPVKQEHVCRTRAVLARPLAVGARAHWRHEPMQLACSSGPPSLEPAQPALHRKSALFVAGDRFTYAPLALINVTFAQSLTRANLDAAMNVSDAARAQWRAVASLPSGPRIAILGTHAGMLTRVVAVAHTGCALGQPEALGFWPA